MIETSMKDYYRLSKSKKEEIAQNLIGHYC